MRRLTSLALALGSLAFVCLGACAQGTSDGPSGHPDAHVVPNQPDADLSNPPDAFVPTPDAFVPPTADANLGPPDADTTGGSCTDSTECANVNPLTCCSNNACVLGVDFGPPIGCVPIS